MSKPSPQDMFVDEKAELAKSTFPIKPDELIALAKRVIAEAQVGVKDPTVLDDKEFRFMGPVVGPLNKEKYLGALHKFDLEKAFPDNNPQFHHFRVDPWEHNRVWFTTAGTMTFTGEFPAFGMNGDGKKIINAHQTNSLVFNEHGKVIKYTIGYVMDRDLGDTGGLGGVFGILYALGKPLPFPEANPWKKSWRMTLFEMVGNVVDSFKPKGKPLEQQKQ